MNTVGSAEQLKAISGFYPTAPTIVDMMLGQLGPLEAHHFALEPSAGRGDIAERLLPLVGKLVCIEPNAILAELLRGKGLLTVESRFEDYTAPHGFDRIAMNPPFVAGLDIVHVQRAFDLLKPGGVLVALMNDGDGTGDGSREQRATFGGWLVRTREIAEASLERLDQHLLLAAENFRPSHVPVKLVRLRKAPGPANEL